MRKYFICLLVCQFVLSAAQAFSAEDYSECKARCAQYYTDCVNEPQATDPEVQVAKEATCNQKTEFCYSDCENLKPVLDNIEPETNPNIIRK